MRKQLLALALVMASPSAAQAATFVVSGNLSGSQEVPVVNSPGTGFATVSFDDVTNLLSVQANFANLLGNTTVAHIHCCSLPGTNAGVATTTPTFPAFPTGVTEGSYSRTFDLTQASSFNAAFITSNGGTVSSARTAFVSGLLGGRAYFNVHTNLFPGGEIRGQLAGAVPEPSTWAMMLLGFGTIGSSMRRRKAKVQVRHAH
jgi:hypothetical protein